MRKTIIITGANRGIGRQVAFELAKYGHKLIMACRNYESALIERDKISYETGNHDIHVMQIDLSSISSINQFVREFKDKHGSIDMLINNAGISNTREKATVDGYNPIIGANYFGTFLLTEQLIPLFTKNADSRIINLSSNIYTYGKYEFSRISRYKWVKAYAVSKLMILQYTIHLATRLKSHNISVNAVHPGIVRTQIMYTKKWYDLIIKVMLAPFFVSIEEGARTIVFLATSEEGRSSTGEFYMRSKKVKIPPSLVRESALEELYTNTRNLLGDKLTVQRECKVHEGDQHV